MKIEMIAIWTNMKNTGCSLEGKDTKDKRMQYGLWKLEINTNKGTKVLRDRLREALIPLFSPNKP